MIDGRRLVVVMPAYNAAETLRRTWDDLPHHLVDQVILVDDGSHDQTVALARQLGLTVHVHPRNQGYGANQKTCYRLALAGDADIVVMVHPDYQYSPRLVGALAAMVASGHYDLVLGSRILGDKARSGGMPLYKYVANRLLTAIENLLLGAKLSEYHTGFRAYSRRLLEALPLHLDSDAFVFDNEVIAQAHFLGFPIGEISCPIRYAPESSSIGFIQACRYGLGVLRVAFTYRLRRWGLGPTGIFPAKKAAAIAAEAESLQLPRGARPADQSSP